MAYLEELLPEFRKGAKITNRSRDKSFFVQMRKDNGIVNSYGEHYSFDFSDFISDGWELYQEPINWDYIIKNKCLCWFWNSDNDNKEYGLLGKMNDNTRKLGYYFVKLKDNRVVLAWWRSDVKLWAFCEHEDVIEVLAPCDYDELQRLKEENKQMFNLLEMVARGITFDCDTEDVIRIISAVKRFCIAKHESEEK